MDLYSPLRNYCERTGDMLLSEPVNALSNLSFFVAAWFLWKAYKANNCRSTPTLVLIIMIAVVGAGSSLFHTFANGLTMLADIIPIALFTFYYLWNALRRLIGLGTKAAVLCLFLFAAAASQTGNVPEAYRFNGSVDYFPCLGALLLISAVLFYRKDSFAKPIALAAALFVVSLTFRSVDFALCQSFPLGTHFMWHLLNGVMLYLLASVFVGRDRRVANN